MTQKHLSIILPTYNNEKEIEQTLRKIKQYLNRQKYTAEVLIVDDGSNDQTISQINKFLNLNDGDFRLIYNQQHIGKGATVQRGMLSAHGEYCLYIEPSLETPLEEIDRLLFWLYQNHDMVIGSRNLYDPAIKYETIWENKLINRSINLLIRCLTPLNFEDTQCGIKAFRFQSAQEIFSKIQIQNELFDVELLCLAKQKELRVKETAVNWQQKESTDCWQKVPELGELIRSLIKIRKLNYRQESTALNLSKAI